MVVFSWLLPFFLAPTFTLQSAQLSSKEGPDSGVSLSVTGVRSEFDTCLDGGFETTFRYEMRLCRKRGWWFDACADQRTELRSARFNPVSETIEVERDRLGDDQPRELRSKSTRDEAYSYLIAGHPWAYSFLARGNTSLFGSNRRYISARLVVDCRGQTTEALIRFSSALTLGLLNVSVLDTNWIDFPRTTQPLSK